VTSRQLTVVNELGLHARAAARFVSVASRFRSQIRVTRGQRTMDGKSILGLLLLAAARGSELTISADGPDEAQAVAALGSLVERGFEET
jgi:phosphotransferase system HPr (HPr) family protein